MREELEMKKYAEEIEGYIFVGNTPTGGDLSELKNIKYIIGDLALDIHGGKLDKNYMLPLFVKKESYNEYNRIMEDQMRKIRER